MKVKFCITWMIILSLTLAPVSAQHGSYGIAFDTMQAFLQSGQTLTSITDEGLRAGNILCTVRGINDTRRDQSVTLITALYQGDALQDLSMGETVTLTKYTTLTVPGKIIAVDGLADDSYMKIMLWSGAQSAEPLVQSVVFGQTGTLAYPATDTTYVKGGVYVNTSFAGSPVMYAGNGMSAFMKFNAAEKPIASAVLNIYVNSGGGTFKLNGITNAWNGESTTYNAPPALQNAEVLGFISVDQPGWQRTDVTSYLNRHINEGTVSFQIEQGEAAALVEIASRHASENQPFLRIGQGYAPEAGAPPLPFSMIQAEDGIYTGQKLSKYSPRDDAVYEAWGRSCVSLTKTGDYTSVTSPVDANKLTVRYSLPLDDVNAVNGTLSLYINGAFQQSVNLTNYRMFEPKSESPSGFVRFWDEITVDAAIVKGDVIKLQRDDTDTLAEYYIDFFQVEQAPAPGAMPNDGLWLSVADYKAGASDTLAIQRCITAAQAQNKNVWLPPGAYSIASEISVPPNIQIAGAGIWHTVLCSTITPPLSGVKKILNLNGNNKVRDLKISDSLGNTRKNVQGISLANDCTVENTAVENIYGAGIIGFKVNHVIVRNCRVTGTFADSIHLADDSKNCLVEGNYIRNSGDDGVALIAYGYSENRNNLVRLNTVECSYWGRGITIQGGKFNVVERNRVVDIANSAGFLATVETFSGKTNLFCLDFLLQDNHSVRSGTTANPTNGGIWIRGHINKPFSGDVQYNRVTETLRTGIAISGYVSDTVRIQYNTIDKPSWTSGTNYINTDSLQEGYTPVVSDNIFRP